MDAHFLLLVLPPSVASMDEVIHSASWRPGMKSSLVPVALFQRSWNTSPSQTGTPVNQLTNESYIMMYYLKRKLGEWYYEAPRPARKQPAVVDADEPGQQPTTRRMQPRQTLPLVEAAAVYLYSISKAFRPEFDAQGAPEREPDRDRAMPGLHSAVFGADRNRMAAP